MVRSNKKLTRQDLYNANPYLSGWAAIADTRGAIADYLKLARDKVEVPRPNCALGKKAVIIGAGVAGLTSAYELLVQEIGCSCEILEANNRIGGRNFTVRPGDTIDELGFDSQTCNFECEDQEPYESYLNAGPGRIPSAHKKLLGYLKRFNVPLEVYVMDSRSNLTYIDGYFGGSVPNRRLANDMRGWLSQILFRFLDNHSLNSPRLSTDELLLFQDFLLKFGDLAMRDNRGTYQGSSRSGYEHLPGVAAGNIEPPLKLQELLQSQFWDEAPFYQPQDFLWQPTLFQPVGGMDRVVYAFQDKVKQLGGKIHLGAVVNKIEYKNSKYLITYLKNGEQCQIEADYCFSNMPIPLMKDVLEDGHFDPSFRQALHAVYKAQDRDCQNDRGEYQARFLADTTKVGWQAPRKLWQEAKGDGAVPIFGGISWSSDEIVQIWYPSDNYHGELGVLTGAYNFQEVAYQWGTKSPSERLALACKGARNLGGEDFANGLAHGLAIAWQNIPHLKGGWANWSAVGEEEPGAKNATYFNALLQGNKDFYIIGDQLSALPGWQEGAVVSAINGVNRVTDPTYLVPELDFLPDTRLMVECL